MESLDTIMLRSTLEQFEEEINAVKSLENWTRDTKEKNFESLGQLADIIAMNGAQLVEKLLAEKYLDSSLLYGILYREILWSFGSILASKRNELDVMTDEELQLSGLSYDWIDEKVRIINHIITQMSEDINASIENCLKPAVEAL